MVEVSITYILLAQWVGIFFGLVVGYIAGFYSGEFSVIRRLKKSLLDEESGEGEIPVDTKALAKQSIKE